MRDLYELYLELGHDVFEERIKKPMELYMHANGNVISMIAKNGDRIISRSEWKIKYRK